MRSSPLPALPMGALLYDESMKLLNPYFWQLDNRKFTRDGGIVPAGLQNASMIRNSDIKALA